MHIPLVMLLWTTRAEQEGEEEEGHFRLRVIHQAAVMVKFPKYPVQPDVGIIVGSVDGFVDARFRSRSHSLESESKYRPPIVQVEKGVPATAEPDPPPALIVELGGNKVLVS